MSNDQAIGRGIFGVVGVAFGFYIYNGYYKSESSDQKIDSDVALSIDRKLTQYIVAY